MKRYGLLIVAAIAFFLIGLVFTFNRPVVYTPMPLVEFIPTPTSTPVSLSVTPRNVLQGDPVMIAILGTSTTADIKSASVGGVPITFALYQGVPTAFFGAGIYQKTGTSTVAVVLKDGQKITGTFSISARQGPVESLQVPVSLGGNSAANQAKLVSTLSSENAELKNLYSDQNAAFWTAPFMFPIAAPITVTDPYGYVRDSGAATIVHEGTDFKAPPGTPVYAINGGVVRLAKELTAYGNTVVIDHGLGIESLYMHLSSSTVSVGQTIEKGELMGYSGETGYAEGPHLHLSIWIRNVSIDPMKFFDLLGVSIAK